VTAVVAAGLAAWLGAAAPAFAQIGALPGNDAPEQVQARQQMAMMESVLETAVSNGAENIVRQVQAVMPDMVLLTGAPRARGFRLEGYGVFFDVDVPEMRRSMTWTLRTLVDENGLALNALAQLRATLDQITDPQVRADAEQAIRRIEQRVGPVNLPAAEPPAADRRTISGASVPAAATTLPAGVDPRLLDEPSAVYAAEVSTALIDAMLQNSGSVDVAPDEWLTVAARDNYSGEPFVPDSADLPTLVLRVRGSDLAAFRAGQLSLDEARARVERTAY